MNATARILMVDDDPEILDLTSRYLSQHGLTVDGARDGAAMRVALRRYKYDLVLLDLMLPGEHGLELCRTLREDSNMPVIMLTALGEEADRIVGLEIGADDYLTKPFSPRELLARIKAVLRRGRDLHAGSPARVSFANWHLDRTRRELRHSDGAVVELTSGEFDLLLAFVDRPGRVLNRDQLLDITRGRVAGPFDRSIDVQLSRLRRKIEDDPKNPEIIKTVRLGGYVFSQEPRQS